MSLQIKEFLASDTLSDVAEKLNFNFDQILLNGGGPQGKIGYTGSIGEIGNPGENGTNWFIGQGIPTSPNTISGAQLEDLYLEKESGQVYQLDQSSNWVIVSGLILKGPTGATGSEGSDSNWIYNNTGDGLEYVYTGKSDKPYIFGPQGTVNLITTSSSTIDDKILIYQSNFNGAYIRFVNDESQRDNWILTNPVLKQLNDDKDLLLSIPNGDLLSTYYTVTNQLGLKIDVTKSIRIGSVNGQVILIGKNTILTEPDFLNLTSTSVKNLIGGSITATTSITGSTNIFYSTITNTGRGIITSDNSNIIGGLNNTITLSTDVSIINSTSSTSDNSSFSLINSSSSVSVSDTEKAIIIGSYNSLILGGTTNLILNSDATIFTAAESCISIGSVSNTTGYSNTIIGSTGNFTGDTNLSLSSYGDILGNASGLILSYGYITSDSSLILNSRINVTISNTTTAQSLIVNSNNSNISSTSISVYNLISNSTYSTISNTNYSTINTSKYANISSSSTLNLINASEGLSSNKVTMYGYVNKSNISNSYISKITNNATKSFISTSDFSEIRGFSDAEITSFGTNVPLSYSNNNFILGGNIDNSNYFSQYGNSNSHRGGNLITGIRITNSEYYLSNASSILNSKASRIVAARNSTISNSISSELLYSISSVINSSDRVLINDTVGYGFNIIQNSNGTISNNVNINLAYTSGIYDKVNNSTISASSNSKIYSKVNNSSILNSKFGEIYGDNGVGESSSYSLIIGSGSNAEQLLTYTLSGSYATISTLSGGTKIIKGLNSSIINSSASLIRNAESSIILNSIKTIIEGDLLNSFNLITNSSNSKILESTHSSIIASSLSTITLGNNNTIISSNNINTSSASSNVLVLGINSNTSLNIPVSTETVWLKKIGMIDVQNSSQNAVLTLDKTYAEFDNDLVNIKFPGSPNSTELVAYRNWVTYRNSFTNYEIIKNMLSTGFYAGSYNTTAIQLTKSPWKLIENSAEVVALERTTEIADSLSNLNPTTPVTGANVNTTFWTNRMYLPNVDFDNDNGSIIDVNRGGIYAHYNNDIIVPTNLRRSWFIDLAVARDFDTDLFTEVTYYFDFMTQNQDFSLTCGLGIFDFATYSIVGSQFSLRSGSIKQVKSAPTSTFNNGNFFYSITGTTIIYPGSAETLNTQIISLFINKTGNSSVGIVPLRLQFHTKTS